MRTGILSNLLLFFLLFCEVGFGAGASLCDSSNRCRVLELLRIHSPNEFTCRVDQWKGIDRLKLRVTIRDLPIPEDPTASDQIRQTIEELLKHSGQIVLKNIQSRNYFRIFADVETDRNDLLDALRKQGLIRPVPAKQAKEEIEAIERPVPLSFSAGRLRPGKFEPAPAAVRSQPVYTGRSLKKLLDTEVDLSGLDSNTTLQEALEVIRLAFEPPLPLAIVWNDLQQNLFIDSETPIGVDGLTKIPLKLALELILSSVSAGTGRPVVLHGDTVLLIVSPEFAARQMKTQVYDVHELAGIPIFADEYGGSSGRTSYSNSGGSGR